MMPASWLRWTPMRAALGALLVAITLAVFTFARAVQLTSVPDGALPVLPNPGALVAPPSGAPLNVAEVIERDAFDVSRVAPTNRYLLPSEMTEDEGPVAPPPRVVVLGIALADGGRSFATCQVGADRPQIVRVGDKLGPYTVKAIARKSVTIALPSGALETLPALNSGFGN